MTRPYLSLSWLQRRFSSGNIEELTFEPGVNLLVGRPNTGKTKWLQTLDFLLGDTGENPFEGAEEAGLADKYDSASAQLRIGDETVNVERRWREPGLRSKVLVNDKDMPARDFQHWLLNRLNIPLLHFPKGNPMSGQTWPELSFRMLLRHIYRQQRFWSGIADQQPDGEQHACLLQFLGLAERVYTGDYGRLVDLKMKVDKLKARRDQYSQTLEELARDVLGEPGLTVSITETSIKGALDRLDHEVAGLKGLRNQLLVQGRETALPPERRSYVERLGEERAELLVGIEDKRRKLKSASDRIGEMQRYRRELSDELDRITRAEDAGTILADLRVTHCPACDQAVIANGVDVDHCFLCHQRLPDQPMIEELGSARRRFERERLSAELTEADELLGILVREHYKWQGEVEKGEERLRTVDRELAPARQAVSSLVQDEVSAIDVALGQATERERQIRRISAALQIGSDLSREINELEQQIEPLQKQVDRISSATDFDAAASYLEDGMNDYLNAINQLRPDVWRHSAISVDITRSSFTLRVGRRRWQAALGGTDTLYFLMAYHYGLLSISDKANCHYPGIVIIDLPGEFSGEAVEDKENFIVQPFINLLSRDLYRGAQLIMTGAAFVGLEGARFQHLTHVHAA